MAKATAGTAARRAARDGLQVHGGIGFTWEHDLHLRLRRAYADDALCGTHEWHLDRLAADRLFAGPTRDLWKPQTGYRSEGFQKFNEIQAASHWIPPAAFST